MVISPSDVETPALTMPFSTRAAVDDFASSVENGTNPAFLTVFTARTDAEASVCIFDGSTGSPTTVVRAPLDFTWNPRTSSALPPHSACATSPG